MHMYGNTPLHKSVYEAHEDCAKLLICQYGANILSFVISYLFCYILFDFLFFCLFIYLNCLRSSLISKKVNSVNKDGDTALHKAAERGHIHFIQLLVDQGIQREERGGGEK